MKHYKLSHLIAALRGTRVERALTQTDLAKRLQLPQSYVSELEAGTRDPRLSTLLEWSRALDFEVMLVPKKLVLTVNEIVSGVDNVDALEMDPSPFKALPQEI